MALVVRTTGVEQFLDAAGEPNIKALIMGEPSSGKTRSASFWPDPIFLDCEGGTMSLADRQVPFVQIESSAEMDTMLRRLEAVTKDIPPPQRTYKTVVIDTLDAYQQMVIQEILGGRDAMAREDWGALSNKMTAFISRLRKLTMNIVVNLHIKANKDGSDGPLVKEPRLSGDIAKIVTADFDLVGWMHTQWEAQDGERVLTRVIKWFPEPGFPVLKDRSGQLPRSTRVDFTDRDYTGLFEAIYGGDAFNNLTPSRQVEEIPVEVGPQPVAPHPGGPVPVGKPQTAPEDKKPRKAAKKATQPPAEPVAAEPVDQPQLTQAVAAVATTLGGRVVASVPVPVEATTQPVCGTGVTATTPAVPGCGKSLTDIDPDLINIAKMKTKTLLCPDCLQKWKANSGK